MEAFYGKMEPSTILIFRVVYCDPEIELYLGFIYCGMVDFFSVEYVA
jgi:hypothetical protein